MCCTYAGMDLAIVCRLCGRREEDVAAARASGRRVRVIEAIVVY